MSNTPSEFQPKLVYRFTYSGGPATKKFQPTECGDLEVNESDCEAY